MMEYTLKVPGPVNRKDQVSLVTILEDALQKLRDGDPVILQLPVNTFQLQQMFADDSSLQAAIVAVVSPGFHRQVDDLIKYVEVYIEHPSHRPQILGGLKKLRGAI
jgi:hypothetical protein